MGSQQCVHRGGYLSVKWYSTLVLTIWFVSACEYLDKRSHNFIFSMLKRYYYPVNPLCAMAAQGMKTVYADPL